MSMLRSLVALAAVSCAGSVWACNVTLNNGADLWATVNNTGVNQTICLNPGTYYVSQQIQMKDGQTIKGLVSDPNISQVKVISSAPDRAIVTANNTVLRHFSLHGNGFVIPTFGVLTHARSNVTLWSLDIRKMNISVGVNAGSSNVSIANVFTSQNGLGNNGIAEPNIWINQSNNILINYGAMTGRANGPAGDGEIACYDSQSVTVYGTQVINSGASGMYFVNCDDAHIENTLISRADEWGLDIHGADNFMAVNNTIQYSDFGGSVFEEAQTIGGPLPANSIGAQYINNRFIGNNVRRVAACPGINIDAVSFSHLYLSGNSVNNGALTCAWNVTADQG